MVAELVHGQCYITQKLLVDLGLGVNPDTTAPTVSNWPVYATSEPGSPDNCITVYNTGGQTLVRKQTDGEWEESKGLQIRVRGTTNAVARTKIVAIKLALDRLNLRQVYLDGTNYLIQCFSRSGDEIDIYKNLPNSKRNVFTLNLFMAVTQYPLAG